MPSTGWWYSWVDWNAGSLGEDFAAIAGRGADHIRIHCLWPLFQPNPNLVSETMLSHLGELMDIADDTDRPVWLQEYGASTQWVVDPAQFLRASTAATLDVDNLWGVTWWCSHDISSELHGFATLEYDLGLLTIGNKVKPAGAAFREMAASWANAERPQPRTHALVLDDDREPGLDFADSFFALIDQGVRPTIELRSTIPGALAGRGISTLHEAPPAGS